MALNDHPDNRKKKSRSPENVVDLTALLKKRREDRERFMRGEELPDEDDFPEVQFPEDDEPDQDYPEDWDDDFPDEKDDDSPESEIPEEPQAKRERQSRPPKKKRSPRELIGDILITAVLLILVLLAGLLIGASLVSVEEISVIGTEWVEEEPVLNWYFPTEKSRILSRAMLKNVLGRSRPPVFSESKVVLTGLRECEIRVKEKEAAFVIGLKNEEGVLMVTGDGSVLRKVPSVPEHLSMIEGISALSSEPMLPALTDQPEVFTQLLRVVKLLSEYEIESDALFIRDGGFCLQIGEVTVCLGTDEWLKEKLMELRNQIPAFTRLRGTLHLEDYDGDNTKDGFTFEVAP